MKRSKSLFVVGALCITYAQADTFKPCTIDGLCGEYPTELCYLKKELFYTQWRLNGGVFKLANNDASESPSPSSLNPRFPEHPIMKVVLIEGPPGVGKTEAIRRTLKKVKAREIELSGPSLLQRYLGDGTALIRRKYDEAAAGHSIGAVVIDEADGSLAEESLKPEHRITLEKELCHQITRYDDNNKVVTIIIVNDSAGMSKALMSRVDMHVQVGYQDDDGRRETIKMHLQGANLYIDDELMPVFVQKTKNMGGRDIRKIARKLKLHCVMEGRTVIDSTLLLEVIAQVRREALED